MSAAVSARWITGRRFDLLWYLGACLTGYFLIYLHVGVGISAALLVWLWILTVDGPHVFGTLSRTYADSEEWRTRRSLLLGSLLWFLVGPVVVFASALSETRVPFLVFLTIAQLWAYWHVVRQHYGFMVLYQKKNAEPAGKENPVDYWVFYVWMLAPFVSFILRHPDARSQMGLAAALTSREDALVLALDLLFAGASALYVAKEAKRAASGAPWNLPKNLFFLAAVPLHLLIFRHPVVSTQVDIRLFAVFVTYYHNIQYHGIVWFYNRNRYQTGDPKRFGSATLVSRNFLTYYALGILFTLAYRYPNWFLAGSPMPFLPGPNAVSATALGPFFSVSDLAIAFWWGFAFHHYYLDQKIWRVSRDPALTRDLKLATT